MSEIKKLYNALLEEQELFTSLRGMTGDWEKDKQRFGVYYEEQMKMLNDFDIVDEDAFE